VIIAYVQIQARNSSLVVLGLRESFADSQDVRNNALRFPYPLAVSPLFFYAILFFVSREQSQSMGCFPRNRICVQTEIPQTRRQNHRWILVFLLLGLAATLVLTFLAGTAQTVALLVNANPGFVACIVLAQALRYVAMTISTRTVAEIVDMRVPFLPMLQATVAASAANRTFVGGAAGLVIRGAFFLRRGMHSGTFAAVEGIEDVVSLCVVALMFSTGLGYVAASGAGTEFRWDVIAALIVGVSLLTIAVILFVRWREWVERVVDGIARGISRVVEKITRRTVYRAERVQRGVDDFYRALALARRDPLRVFIAFLCAFGRLGCDWVALFFAFRAIGYDVSLGTVLLIFIVSSSVATIAAVPGQIGVIETTLALMSTAVGIPAPVAVSATLLYRLVSFWLPIPFGYAFAWNLERRAMI
jgi:glycosyltransferase 2 family protein